MESIKALQDPQRVEIRAVYAYILFYVSHGHVPHDRGCG